MTKWKVKTSEDRQLKAYWDRNKVGGKLYLEVPVGHPSPGGVFPPESRIRYIDAVRVLRKGSRKREEVQPSRGRTRDILMEAFRNAEIEVIEAKKRLNRFSFGQAVAGADMIKKQYKPRKVTPVIVYEIGDPAMEWVCRKHGVRIWQSPPRGR